jgi:hypothetical protein
MPMAPLSIHRPNFGDSSAHKQHLPDRSMRNLRPLTTWGPVEIAESVRIRFINIQIEW